jgi:hypothetical protein
MLEEVSEYDIGDDDSKYIRKNTWQLSELMKLSLEECIKTQGSSEIYKDASSASLVTGYCS